MSLNIDFGSGAVARRADIYFQVDADGNSPVFERSKPYTDPNRPLGASILASRQVERLYQTLRGLLDEDSRQLLTMQRQSWLGGRGLFLVDAFGINQIPFNPLRLLGIVSLVTGVF